MAKQRYINTRFWNDSYIAELDPVEKLLFIYLLTNEHTNICGIYEVPLKVVALETGIDRTMIGKVLIRLKEKIRYVNGWIVIKNFLKHQENTSERVHEGVMNRLREVPIAIIEKALKNEWYYIPPGYPIDTLSIGPELLTLKLKPKLELKPSEATPSEKAEAFFTATAHDDLIGRLVHKGVSSEAAANEVRKFISYWTEKNRTGSKQRWQMEKTFEVERRLVTWFGKVRDFNRKQEKHGIEV